MSGTNLIHVPHKASGEARNMASGASRRIAISAEASTITAAVKQIGVIGRSKQLLHPCRAIAADGDGLHQQIDK